jgi:hypothetical protein
MTFKMQKQSAENEEYMDSSLRTTVIPVGKASFRAERIVMQHAFKTSFDTGDSGLKKSSRDAATNVHGLPLVMDAMVEGSSSPDLWLNKRRGDE